MNRRLVLLITLGILVIAGGYALPRYLLWKNRYRPWREVVDEEYRNQMKAELASMRRNAKTQEENLLITFQERGLRAKSFAEEIGVVDTSNGVDQYEAWLIGRAYLIQQFGVCGSVSLPVRDGDHWTIPTYQGTLGKPHPLSVAVTDGRTVCEGYPTVTDAMLLVRPSQKPNPESSVSAQPETGLLLNGPAPRLRTAGKPTKDAPR